MEDKDGQKSYSQMKQVSNKINVIRQLFKGNNLNNQIIH